MIKFGFSTNIVSRIIEEFEKAEKFIRIAIFQLHNKNVFEVLNNRLKDGISVEILTLPYDSINADVQEALFNILKIYKRMGRFCIFVDGISGIQKEQQRLLVDGILFMENLLLLIKLQ